MINKSAINPQLSALSSQQAAVSYQQNLQHRSIEDLKGRTDPAALQSAAKELEALFAYEMIKAMRQTTETSKGGFGKDAYMSLFDTELSRIFADRGIGLKEVLLKGLNRQSAKGNQATAVGGQPNALSPQQSAISGQPTVISPKSSAISPQQSVHSYQDKKAGMLNIGVGQQPSAMSGQQPESVPNASVPKILSPLPPAPATPSLVPEAQSPAGSSSAESNIPVDGVISSNFGIRRHPVHGDSSFHHGMDIAAPVGTEIYPYQGGKVIFSGEKPGYGNMVVIDHGNGYVTKYAHNRINLVKAGDVVDGETIIAEVGSTGLSTGSHLHFEVKRDGKYLDPAKVLALK